MKTDEDIMAPNPIPDHLGYVTGIRAWGCMLPGYLVNVCGSFVYEPRKRGEAICLVNSTHAAPMVNCRCGFYLVKPNVLDQIDPYVGFHPYTSAGIWGYAAGWGKVIECEFGWRVQYTYPLSIVVHSKRRDLHEALTTRYGVPVSIGTFEEEFPGFGPEPNKIEFIRFLKATGRWPLRQTKR